VRTGAGVSGSDRVELTWASGAIAQQGLEVIVKPTARTGLPASDVFFYGSAIGATGVSSSSTVFMVGAGDTTGAQTHLATLAGNQPITNLYDFNRDGIVGAGDITIDQNHGTTSSTGLVVLTIAAAGPIAALPSGAGGDGDVSGESATPDLSSQVTMSALSASAPGLPMSAVPAWIANRLGALDLNQGPLARFFEHLAAEDTPQARKILVTADELAGSLGLDDAWLDSLLAEFGMGAGQLSQLQ
jgi:hypothetical protein